MLKFIIIVVSVFILFKVKESRKEKERKRQEAEECARIYAESGSALICLPSNKKS